MGYYTSYALQIQTKDSSKNDTGEIMKDFRTTYEYVTIAINENGEPSDSCKWYDHEDNLKEFSKKYPDWKFTLHGEGEESGDIWIKYFVNGKMQQAAAQITFAIFDESKLK